MANPWDDLPVVDEPVTQAAEASPWADLPEVKPWDDLPEVKPWEDLPEVEDRGFIERNITGPVKQLAAGLVSGAKGMKAAGPGVMLANAEGARANLDREIEDLTRNVALEEQQIAKGVTTESAFSRQGMLREAFSLLTSSPDEIKAETERLRNAPVDQTAIDALAAKKQRLAELQSQRSVQDQRVQRWSDAHQRFAEATVEGWIKPPENMSTAEWMTRTVGKAVPSLLTAAGVTFATGSPTAGALVLSSVQGVDAYLESRKAGMPVDEANRVFLLETGLSTFLERIPLDVLVKGIDGNRLVRAVKNGSVEGAQEVVDTIKSNLIAQNLYDENRQTFDGWAEAFVGGFGSGGVVGAMSPAQPAQVPTVGSPAAPGVQPLEANVQMQGTEGQLTGPQPAAVPSAVQPGAAPASIASPAEPSFDGSERVTKKVLRTLPEPRLRTMAAEFGMANAETAPLDLVIDRVHRMQPLITERGTASTDIDARVDRSGLRGELEGLQQRLEVTSRDLRSGAQQAGRVAVSEGAGQEIQGWRSAGSVYPEGMSADTATALKNYLSGQLVTPKQLNEVERALNYVSVQVSRDAGFDVEMQEPKAQLDMVAGDRLSIDGVPFVISRQLPDGSLELQGPTGARVIGMDDTTLIDRGSYQPGSEADRTMAEQATLDTIEGRMPGEPGAAASLFPFETEATQPEQATKTAPRPWQEVRRDIVAAMGPTKAARFDEIRVKESNEAAVQWAEQELNPVRDLGEGNQATRQPDGTWTLKDSQGDEMPLDWDNADDQDILRVLDPDEHHKRTVATVAEITKGWSGPVTVTVVKNAEGLPEAVRSKVSETGAEGVYVGTSPSGKTTVYVFSDNVSAARAPVTAIHEAVGHAGIRAVLGNKLETVLDQIYGGRPSAQLEEIAKDYGLDLNTPEGRQEATEELIAQMAEWQQTNPGMWNRAIAAIRSALRSVGITNTWTDNDLAVLIGKAREHVEGKRADDPSNPSDTTDIRMSLPQPDYNARSRAAALAAIKRKQAAKGKVMSQFAERIAMDAGTSTPDADRIMQNRGSWRTPQDLAKMKGDLRSATEGELYEALNAPFDTTSPEGQTAGLALGELMNRRLATNQPISDLIDSGAKLGRTLGQLLRQYGEIKTSTPAGAVSVIEAEVKKAGRALTDAQRARLIAAADADIKARRAFKAAQQMHEQLFNDQTEAAVDVQGKAANEASTAFIRAARDVMPPNVANMLTTMMQGNLLSPMSQVSNVVGNLAMIPMRSSAQSIAAAADALDVFLRRNVFRQTNAQRSVLNPFVGSREAARGAVAGARDAGRQFISGPDTVAGESYRGFRPFTAFLQGWTGYDMSVDPVTGKVRKTDRALRLIEGTLGAAPETMLRALQFGDMPIREATRRKTLAEIAKIRGLSGPALEKFVAFPDDTAAALADKESREAVFQQDNSFAAWWSSLPEHLQSEYRGVARVLQKTITPFSKTPANVIFEVLQYAIPELSMAKAVINYRKGNRREAYLSLGKAATGWMVMAAGHWLITRGLMSGDPDEDDKYRQLQYSTVAPNTVNVDGVKRALNGEDPEWREGDRLVGFNKLGAAGQLLNIMANRGRRAMQETTTPAEWEWLSIGRAAELGSSLLQLPMMKGSASFIQALDNPKKVDSWMNAWFETVSSIVLPNTLSALNRVQWEYLPERRGDTRLDSFANIWKAKLFQADELPLKRDMFGRPIQATPGGTTPIVYQLIDVTKSRKIPNDPKIRAIWNVYNATLDGGVIPNSMDRAIKDPKLGKRDLTVKEYNRLQELVGKYRGAYLDALTKTPAWLRAGQEARAKQLKDIWSDSRERALTAFWTEMYNPNGTRLLPSADQQILSSKP